MTRDELLKLINLHQELIPIGKQNRPGVTIKPVKITIHNTSNTSPGADAKAHSKFVRETGYYLGTGPNGEQKKSWVSLHYTVDDKTVINQLPNTEKALHAGSPANTTSVAIEICMHKGIEQAEANTRAAQLTALLCYDLSVPIADIVPHKHWTGKDCPVLLLKNWNDFLKSVTQYLEDLNKEDFAKSSKSIFFSKDYPAAFEMPMCWEAECSDENELLRPETAPGVQHSFNEKFLPDGVVRLPSFTLDMPGAHYYSFVHHQNMSIYFNQTRKLALYTACNFDKEAFIDMDRSDAFREDPLVKADTQLAQGFYKSPTLDKTKSQNYFDRGHIIARRYNQWGSNHDEAKAGERDTYYFTTIHPQVEELNKDEWEKLEDFIINQKKLKVKRVSVIAGAIFKPNDPVATYIDNYYKDSRTIQIPEAFWKIVYYEVDNELRKIAFLMSQRRRIKEIPFIAFPTEKLLISDPFDAIDNPLKTYIINSSLITETIYLEFSEAKELYDKLEPMELVMEDNETHFIKNKRVGGNLADFI
jgi:DNA/RNA endonuclease G (NUC1)